MIESVTLRIVGEATQDWGRVTVGALPGQSGLWRAATAAEPALGTSESPKDPRLPGGFSGLSRQLGSPFRATAAFVESAPSLYGPVGDEFDPFGVRFKDILRAAYRQPGCFLGFDRLTALALGMPTAAVELFETLALLDASQAGTTVRGILARTGLPSVLAQQAYGAGTLASVLSGSIWFVDDTGKLCNVQWDTEWWGVEIYFDKGATALLRYVLAGLLAGTLTAAGVGALTSGTGVGLVVAIVATISSGVLTLMIQSLDRHETCSGVTLNKPWIPLEAFSFDSGNTT